MSKQKEWIEFVLKGDSIMMAAKKIGVGYTTLYRQVTEDRVLPQTVVAVAKAYDADILDGFVAIDLITEQDRERYLQPIALESFSDLELANEALRRVTEYNRRLDGSAADENKPVTPEPTACESQATESTTVEETREPAQGIVTDMNGKIIISEEDLKNNAAFDAGYDLKQEAEESEECP